MGWNTPPPTINTSQVTPASNWEVRSRWAGCCIWSICWVTWGYQGPCYTASNKEGGKTPRVSSIIKSFCVEVKGRLRCLTETAELVEDHSQSDRINFHPSTFKIQNTSLAASWHVTQSPDHPKATWGSVSCSRALCHVDRRSWVTAPFTLLQIISEWNFWTANSISPRSTQPSLLLPSSLSASDPDLLFIQTLCSLSVQSFTPSSQLLPPSLL